MGWLLLFLFTPLAFAWLALLLGICFAIVYTCKRAFRIKREEIKHPKGSLVSLTFQVWGIDVAAWLVSFVTMFLVTYRMPFFEGINSEWGIAFEHAYPQAYVFLAIWAVFYAALMLPSYFCFKKRIVDRTKRNMTFICFDVFSAVIGFALIAVLI